VVVQQLRGALLELVALRADRQRCCVALHANEVSARVLLLHQKVRVDEPRAVLARGGEDGVEHRLFNRSEGAHCSSPFFIVASRSRSHDARE
jgi:hypothetical protein